jgi:UDP-2,4-diacetamido-2,4,6-trideoxy-beta-L-altropyranose hydrolase
MRCLALAQAWQDAGGRALFAMAEATTAIRAKLSAESCEVVTISSSIGTLNDAAETIAVGKDREAEWIVVDGYNFTDDYQCALKESGFKLLVLDDYGQARHYYADLVLNQNVSASESMYASRNPDTEALLGPHYCLLRREFSAWRDWKRKVSQAGRRVLVTMGGSDPENVTTRIVDALALLTLEDLEGIVVVGGSSPHSELEERSRFPLDKLNKIIVRRDVTNMAELMAWADVAISSAGTTCWELCLLSLPAILVDVAANQTALAQELSRRHCAIHLGRPEDFTPVQLASQLESLLNSWETRDALSVRCRELVDGKGAQRVVSAMRSAIRLRPMRENDSRLLWEWANDPQVRAAAFSQGPIPWEEHRVWFASKMRDPDCRILVAEDSQGRPVGQFRVDWRTDQDGEIDVSVSSECRGEGYGAVLIDFGVSSAFKEKGERLHAIVKEENQASRRSFEQAGFTALGEERVHGERAIHYIRTKDSVSMRSD